MGDVTTKLQKGRYVGLIAVFRVFGSAYLMRSSVGLESNFSYWFRHLFCYFGLNRVPETERTLVGSDSATSKSFLNKALIFQVVALKKSFI